MSPYHNFHHFLFGLSNHPKLAHETAASVKKNKISECTVTIMTMRVKMGHNNSHKESMEGGGPADMKGWRI